MKYILYNTSFYNISAKTLMIILKKHSKAVVFIEIIHQNFSTYTNLYLYKYQQIHKFI